jgi:hypothetical protein
MWITEPLAAFVMYAILPQNRRLIWVCAVCGADDTPVCKIFLDAAKVFVRHRSGPKCSRESQCSQ